MLLPPNSTRAAFSIAALAAACCASDFVGRNFAITIAIEFH